LNVWVRRGLRSTSPRATRSIASGLRYLSNNVLLSDHDPKAKSGWSGDNRLTSRRYRTSTLP
jgi:hypothetical protein